MYLIYKLFYYYSVDNTTVSDYSDDEPENNENITTRVTLAESIEYNRSLFLTLLQPREANRDNKNNDTKSVAFKKNNVPQMSRKKANRALNGIFVYIYIIYFFIYMFVYLQ